MVKYYDSLTPELSSWILAQPVFFVASAPLTGKHINVSPKGLPASSFALTNPNHAAYVDATGSGNETISHVRENGRLTVMFCSFEAMPRILRLFCRGKVTEWDEPGFVPWLNRLQKSENVLEGARAVISLDIFKVQTSCGYGVPRLALSTDPATQQPRPYLQDRETMGHWANNKIEKNELHAYQKEWNAESLDGLPGMRAALRDAGSNSVMIDGRIWMCRHRRILELVAVMILSVLSTVIIMSTYIYK